MDETKNNVSAQMKNNLGNSMAIVISFDTTGSMRRCIAQVRQKLRDLVEMMSADIPGLKIGLIAHGDYCDGENAIMSLDLTDDLEQIMNFINTAPDTSGGCAPECYELALQTARKMSWTEEGGSVVIIGDDEPHEADPRRANINWGNEVNVVNPDNIDWRDEVRTMLELNVKVFPMQCLFQQHRAKVNAFWEEISQISQTPLLMLDSFDDSANVLEAVAYSSMGDMAYEGYKSKFTTEVDCGTRTFASSNLAENQTKLEAFSKTRSNNADT